LNQKGIAMSTVFRGDYATIRRWVRRVDATGCWREIHCGGRQYRTDRGAILNWWEASGKIAFQGNGDAALKFEEAFKALALQSDRLTDDQGRTLKELTWQNGTLRSLVADVLLENAKLRRHMKKKKRRIGRQVAF
jgi:hypothetical protein